MIVTYESICIVFAYVFLENNSMKQVTNRFERVDQARGIAIALMILFHIYYSATNIFGFENYVFSDDVWFYIGKISALLFISIA